MPCREEAAVCTRHTTVLLWGWGKDAHLHLESPPLDLRDALGDDEGDPVTGTAGHLRELPAEQLQTALELLVATLDGQSLQTALVTSQETLRTEKIAATRWSQKLLPVGPSESTWAHTPSNSRNIYPVQLQKVWSSFLVQAGNRLSVFCIIYHTNADENTSSLAEEPKFFSGHKSDCLETWLGTHLLALSPLEVNVAVTLAALGGGPQLPQPVGPGCFGQADVTERSGGHHHIRIHAVNIWRKRSPSRIKTAHMLSQFSRIVK